MGSLLVDTEVIEKELAIVAANNARTHKQYNLLEDLD